MLRIKTHPETGIYQISGTVERGGERIRTSARTTDRQAAQNAATAIERDYWERRAAGKQEVVLFEEAVASYKRAGGDHRFTDALTLHFAGTPVRDILPGHVHDAARALYGEWTPATQNRQAITPASAILNHAAKRGWCNIIRVERFKEEKVHRVAANREWLDAFMAEAEPEIAALALFMFTTGARISEALSLRWEDVEGRNARIRKTKSGAGRDCILIREATLLFQALARDGKRVFRYKSKRWVYSKWQAACERAGIDYIRPHQAGRHAFATEMIVRKGVDVMTTAKLGGWASARMLDRYAHPDKRLEDVVDAVFATPKPKARKVE